MPSDASHLKPEDSVLLRAAKAGDLSAYEQLVWRYQTGIRAFVAVRLAVPHDAEDLAQETFVVAWRKLASFDPDTSFGSWLRMIAHNLVLNHRRKFRAVGVGGHNELEELMEGQPASIPRDAPERLTALTECLASMDEPARQLLKARYLDGRTVREIAVKTGRGYSALTMQLFRLRELLAACVENKLAFDHPQS